MRTLAGLIAALALITLTTTGSADGDRCITHNHDGSFEEAISWDGSGVQSPYYGAFGEAFYVGYGLVYGAVLWLTQDGTYNGQTYDLYFWENGYEGEPGYVIWEEFGVTPTSLPIWPEVGENYVDVEVYVEGSCTVGFWGNWPGEPAGFFVAADSSYTQQGHPWTNIAPGLQWPSGWQHPDVVWGRRHIEALGLGIDIDRPSPARPQETWGAIKSLFR